MEKSESIKELAAALAKAQGEFNKVVKASKSHHGKYADMAVLVDAVTPALHNNGLSVTQMPYRHDDKQIGVETILLHSSGEFIGSKFYGSPDNQTPQKIGSLITYYRRYSLMAIVGVAPSDDDDGNQAQSHAIKKRVIHASEKQLDNLFMLMESCGEVVTDERIEKASKHPLDTILGLTKVFEDKLLTLENMEEQNMENQLNG